MHNKDEVYNASLEYFNGDQLAASVFATKYALQDHDGSYLELTPADMHRRLAKEFARIENKYSDSCDNQLDEEEIFELFKNFK